MCVWLVQCGFALKQFLCSLRQNQTHRIKYTLDSALLFWPSSIFTFFLVQISPNSFLQSFRFHGMILLCSKKPDSSYKIHSEPLLPSSLLFRSTIFGPALFLLRYKKLYYYIYWYKKHLNEAGFIEFSAQLYIFLGTNFPQIFLAIIPVSRNDSSLQWIYKKHLNWMNTIFGLVFYLYLLFSWSKFSPNRSGFKKWFFFAAKIRNIWMMLLHF